MGALSGVNSLRCVRNRRTSYRKLLYHLALSGVDPFRSVPAMSHINTLNPTFYAVAHEWKREYS